MTHATWHVRFARATMKMLAIVSGGRVAGLGKAQLIERELAGDGDLGVEDLFDQVMTNVEIQNAITGMRSLTPRRVVNEIFLIVRARKRNELPPYPETALNGVAWLLTSNH